MSDIETHADYLKVVFFDGIVMAEEKFDHIVTSSLRGQHSSARRSVTFRKTSSGMLMADIQGLKDVAILPLRQRERLFEKSRQHPPPINDTAATPTVP